MFHGAEVTLLDKPHDYNRPAAQTARNKLALHRLLDGDLKPGELFDIVTGRSPASMVSDQSPVMIRTCIDCARPIDHDGPPLKSQPRRCRPCGTKKRKEHNDNYHAAT